MRPAFNLTFSLFANSNHQATTSNSTINLLSILQWPWKQFDGAETFIATASMIIAYVSVLTLIVLVPILVCLCCRYCCFTFQCCCTHERLPLAMRLCSNHLGCLLRLAKCCCASSTVSPQEAALPPLWITTPEATPPPLCRTAPEAAPPPLFHTAPETAPPPLCRTDSMYGYQTEEFGATVYIGTKRIVLEDQEDIDNFWLRAVVMDHKISERKRRRDERRAKRAKK